MEKFLENGFVKLVAVLLLLAMFVAFMFMGLAI